MSELKPIILHIIKEEAARRRTASSFIMEHLKAIRNV
jgi:hypothetical protein